MACAAAPPSLDQEPVWVQISGGGIYGGINPTTEDSTVIESSVSGVSKIRISASTLYGTPRQVEREVDRVGVLELVRTIEALDFFALQERYNLDETEKAARPYPSPVPIRVEIRARGRTHVVQALPPYPASLSQTIDRILVFSAKKAKE